MASILKILKLECPSSCLESLLKHRFLGLTPRVSDSVRLV